MKLSYILGCYWQQGNINPTELDANQNNLNKRKDSLAKPYYGIVSISDVSKWRRIAEDTAFSASDIRTEKVEKVEQQIAAGTYKINVDQIAERILDSVALI